MNLEVDQQPSFPDLSLASFDEHADRADASSFRDVSRRVQAEIKYQDRASHSKAILPLSEQGRRELYGCPSRSKQLEALVHSIRLIEDKDRPEVISATGEGLVL